MDYSKYLQCSDCQESGLYCKTHRIEIETDLRKKELAKILKMKDHWSPRYIHVIRGMLESYDIWKTC